MIRIDEIYYNVFACAMQSRSDVGLHWFDPFGSTDFQDLVCAPVVDYYDARKRILFWDQEPLHLDIIDKFLEKFVDVYRTSAVNHQYPIILVTSEHESENVKQICDTYNLESSYYFFHAWAALDWYRGYNHSFLFEKFRDRQIEKTFLCPNNIVGGKRKHRLTLFAELVKKQCAENNFISFPATCPYEGKTVQELCKEHQIDLLPIDLPLIIDSGAGYATQSHRIDMWKLAERSLLHVVTETVYDQKRHHLTEKTFKPIVLQQPFILLSCQGSLEYLRQYGFRTFNEFWNEDYDYFDDSSRALRVAQLISDLDGLSLKEKIHLQKHLTATVEYNYDWFYSREFENLLWGEMTNMISQW